MRYSLSLPIATLATCLCISLLAPGAATIDWIGPRLLLVQVVDEQGIGISEVYCQQINSVLYQQTVKRPGVPGLEAKTNTDFAGALTVEGDSGIALLSVMCAGSDEEDGGPMGRKTFVRHPDGDLILVHPLRGVKQLKIENLKIRWIWSSELNTTIGFTKVVLESPENKKVEKQ